MKPLLAMLAVLFLLLRPLCEVQAAGLGHEEAGAHAHAAGSGHPEKSVPCCAELDEGALVAPSLPALAPGVGDGKAGFLAPVLHVWPAERRAGALARHPPDALPPLLSFHARTARIRR
jgi:hypothetical protein